MKTAPQVSLYAILARTSPLAVVFRRGPSKEVLLALWNTENDRIEYGQWFRGRIYERRCDLSPNGDLLVYFAAKYKKPIRSWTAVSRPPFLTALAFWPKGDGWGGGGQFASRHALALNHRKDEMNLGADFSLPRTLRVAPYGVRPGWGEDIPIWADRLKRDGWKRISYPTSVKYHDVSSMTSVAFSHPIIWSKPNPIRGVQLSLEMSITGLGERDGRWYMTEHRIVDPKGAANDLGKTEWADWSRDGDLLYSKGGCLLRVRRHGKQLQTLSHATKVADLSALKFEAREAPKDVLNWPT